MHTYFRNRGTIITAGILMKNVDKEDEICARDQGDHFVFLLQYEDAEKFRMRIMEIKGEVEEWILKETDNRMLLQMGIYYLPKESKDLRLAISYANQALDYAGRMTAVESSEVESENALLISAKGFFLSEIRNYDLIDKYVYGGKPGISILQSDMSGDHIELVAKYKIKFPINFFNIGIISLEQHGYHRKWTGKHLTSSEDEYVYYTDTGEVYHLTSTCNYLDLSIHTANYSQIETLRNRSNHRYSACSCAVANISANSTVYITDYGIRYHSNLHCSGLKRTIHMVRRSEVGNRRLCSKCARAANQ